MTFLGWLSDPFKGLSDLQLGDEKGTLNHLGCMKPFGDFDRQQVSHLAKAQCGAWSADESMGLVFPASHI